MSYDCDEDEREDAIRDARAESARQRMQSECHCNSASEEPCYYCQLRAEDEEDDDHTA